MVPLPNDSLLERAAAPSSARDPRRLGELLEELLRLGPSSTDHVMRSLHERREVRIDFSGGGKGGQTLRLGDIEGMLRELSMLGWIDGKEDCWAVTSSGEALARTGPVKNPGTFARALCVAHEERNKRVITRLLARLWEINPEAQGAVVLARFRLNELPASLGMVAARLSEMLPPWLASLSKQMSGFTPRASVDDIVASVGQSLGEGWEKSLPGMRRKRLEEAVRHRLLDMLFGGVIAPRDFSVWQTRMDWAGLTLLTHRLPGTGEDVWFPVGAFRQPGNPSFTAIDTLRSGDLPYCVHTPSGPAAEETFAALLFKCYRARQQREKVEYVSLLSVRDHVCYLLRTGNAHFEKLLQAIFPRVLRGDLPYAMSLEVDLTPADRKRIAGLLPVTIDHTPRYILSMRRR